MKKWQKVLNRRNVLISLGLITAMVPNVALASGFTPPTIDYTSAFQGIVTSAFQGISAALPLAAIIFGAMLAVSLGMKVYRKLAGR